MKIRTDFVTNSSSSSFVIAFKDEEDMDFCKEDMLRFYSENLVWELFDRIKEHAMTLEELRERYAEELHCKAYYHILYEDERYAGKKYEWTKTEEYKKAEEEYVNEGLAEFDEHMKDQGIFSIVEYSDHEDGGFMEQIMVPNAPFVFAINSHH